MKDIIEKVDEAFAMTTDDERSTVGISRPDWAKIKAAAQKADALERQLLAGLQALGIGCKSIDQCASFEREVAGTVNVLEEHATKAEKRRDQVIRRVIEWCEDPRHRRNRTLNQQCEMLDALRAEMLEARD